MTAANIIIPKKDQNKPGIATGPLEKLLFQLNQKTPKLQAGQGKFKQSKTEKPHLWSLTKTETYY